MDDPRRPVWGTESEPSRILEVRLSPEVLYRDLVREAVLLDLDSQRYFGLDEVGSRLWELLAEDGDLEAAVASLLREFEVDEARLRSDLDVFLRQLAEAGLVELRTAP